MNLKEQHELIIRNYPKEWTPVDDCDYWVGDGRIQYFLLIQLKPKHQGFKVTP